MKKFLVLFAIFAALTFIVSCGGKKKTADDGDTGETVTDEDTGNTEPSGDTEPADDTDTTPEQNDDDADTAQRPDPCSDDPCAEIENATECIPHGDLYECGCIENYAWDSGTNKCVDPCDPNPCNDIKNSDGICSFNKNKNDYYRYTCGCLEHYHWNDGNCEADDPEYEKREECRKAGGTWHGQGNTESCVKPRWCEGKPENSEWIKDSTGFYVSATYADGVWSDEVTFDARYNGNWKNDWSSVRPCDFRCEENHVWNGKACTVDFPECSTTSGSPCYRGGFIWSDKAPEKKNWEDAVSYCNKLTEDGFIGWHLPNIDGLKTLLIAERASACKVSEKTGCLSIRDADCWTCDTCTETGTAFPETFTCEDWGTIYDDGRYSVFGDTGSFWSSSEELYEAPLTHWTVDFNDGGVKSGDNGFPRYFRCAMPYDPQMTACIKSGKIWDSKKNLCIKQLSIGSICTNQKKCYDNDVEIACPDEGADFFGQDAQYTDKCTEQSFTYKNDGNQQYYVDDNTGLTWERILSEESYAWDDREAHCDDLNAENFAGINNWRLPNPLEFLTLIDVETSNPNPDVVNRPAQNTIYFWTSKEYTADTSKVFNCSMYWGNCFARAKTNSNRVICVSGYELLPTASSDFVAQPDGKIVVDQRTGLIWQNGYTTGESWQNALTYCEDLNYAGYTDWRLPNKNELVSLLDLDRAEAPYSSASLKMPDTDSNNFWSSSTGGESRAWVVGFDKGNEDYNPKGAPYTYTHNVRCVRGGKLPTCSETSETPCLGPNSDLAWSKKAPEQQDWDNAVSYCNDLVEGGLTGWRLPNIDELRKLMTTERTSACKVSEESGCLSIRDASCWTCDTCTETGTVWPEYSFTCEDWGTVFNDGRYSVFGDTGSFWSSSEELYEAPLTHWTVDFNDGGLKSGYNSFSRYYRCVRNATK